MSDKKFLVAILALGILASIGCNRNKPAATAPVATGYQPAVAAAAPAPATHRSSTYIK